MYYALGLDDNLREEGLNIVPRLPDGWSGMEASGYGIYGITEAGRKKVLVDLKYERIGGGYRLKFSAREAVKVGYLRMGPFAEGIKDIKVKNINGYKLKGISGKLFVVIDVDNYVPNGQICKTGRRVSY